MSETYPTKRDVANVIFDLLIDDDWQKITHDDFWEWAECENEDERHSWIIGWQEAFGLTEEEFEKAGRQFTKSDFESAYARLGFSLADDRISHDHEQQLRDLKWKVDCTESAIRQCGDDPQFAVAKRNYEADLESHLAGLKACENGVLI